MSSKGRLKKFRLQISSLNSAVHVLGSFQEPEIALEYFEGPKKRGKKRKMYQGIFQGILESCTQICQTVFFLMESCF